MENKRDLLERAMRGEEVERVPCGFWHHFILGKDQFIGLEQPEVLERAYEGHKKYYDTVRPDMMKLMSEGFFGYPPIMDNPLETEEDLRAIKAVGKNHPWIREQVKHVKRLVDAFHEEVFCFYNIFSPLQMIRIKFDFLDLDFDHFVRLAEAYPDALYAAGQEIMKDVMDLVRLLFEEARIDGIYYCVQNIQSKKYDKALYDKIIRPCEKPVLDFANSCSDSNILHICGYARHTNHFAYYKDYAAKIYNWAIHTDGVSLEEGRKYFQTDCVLGGFDNNPGTLIDCGTKEELEEEVRQLIAENGYRGFILGADCSIPNDIDDARVRIIRDACHKFRK